MICMAIVYCTYILYVSMLKDTALKRNKESTLKISVISNFASLKAISGRRTVYKLSNKTELLEFVLKE